MADNTHIILVRIDGQEFQVEVEDLNVSPVIARVNGRAYQVYLEAGGGRAALAPEARVDAAVPAPPVTPQATAAAATSSVTEVVTGVVTAPMPGDIVEVMVAPGQDVQAGDPLCVLDAMKMKNKIYSPQAGRVASVEVAPGQAVDYGAVLVRFE